MGRYLIHAFVGGYIDHHGIIKNQAAGKSYFCDHKNNQNISHVFGMDNAAHPRTPIIMKNVNNGFL